MRLLHIDDEKGLILTNFTGKTIPPYAILSHRWGNDEVLFEDVTDQKYKSRVGYQKVKFCAKLAAEDGIKYFWIDTCCIDKWNLHEVSVAINSMFSWYRNAKTCYVFMSDVSVANEDDTRHGSKWEARFRASKWFTRGWTLQELIAPRSVEFFSSQGYRIGNKNSLEQLIQQITNVPAKALQGCPLEHFSVSCRMEWAKHRETTEPEDSVYCLLGILDLVMPISYNEGRENALRRLHDELEATDRAPCVIPFSRNPQFVGRESQLVEIEARLSAEQDGTRIAIAGPGGTGKSQLALELAFRIKQKRRNCSVFWVDASDVDNLHKSYSSIAHKLNIPGWNDEKIDIKQQLKQYLSGPDTGHWLLIYDGVDSLSLKSTGLFSLRSTRLIDYIPQSESSSIIFTSTNDDVVESLAPQSVVRLQSLTSNSARKMFEKYVPNPGSRSQEQEVELLLAELSYLPLAIVQAAAYINTKNVTIKEYRMRLRQQKEEAFELSKNSDGDKSQDLDLDVPTTATLLVSLDQLRNDHSLAANYLFLASCVDRKDISLDFLETAIFRKREHVVKALSSYALITRRPAESSIDVHQLVHLSVRKWLQKHKLLSHWVRIAIDRLLNVFPQPDDKNRSRWRRLLPHTQSVLSHSVSDNSDPATGTLMWKCAMSLHNDGWYTESEELWEHSMEMCVTKLGANHPDTLTYMSNLALTYNNQGRWSDAEKLGSKVLEARMKSLGAASPDTLTSMSNLASTYTGQGRWQEAEELGLQAVNAHYTEPEIHISSTLDGIMHVSLSTKQNTYRSPSQIASMHKLASTYIYQSKWVQAEQLLTQVMEAYRDHSEANGLAMITSLNDLALVYRGQGRWKEAQQLLVQVVEMRKSILGSDHPSTLTGMSNLALSYSDQTRYEEAEQLLTQVIEAETRKTRSGADHPSTLVSMNILASVLRKKGDWEKAEQLAVKVLQTRNALLGTSHPSTLTSMRTLASIYKEVSRWEEAEELLIRVAEAYETSLGRDHEDTLTNLIDLAIAWKNLGRDIRAIQLMRDCVERWNCAFGATHHNTASFVKLLREWEIRPSSTDNEVITMSGNTT